MSTRCQPQKTKRWGGHLEDEGDGIRAITGVGEKDGEVSLDL